MEERGDYSVRGGVIDFFPPLSADPIRLEFWGDTVESIRHFNATTQRSSKYLEDVIVLPVSEVFLDPQSQKLASTRLRSVKSAKVLEYLQRREHFPQIERYLPYFYDKTETLWDYLPKNCLVANWDPLNIKQELDTYLAAEDLESREPISTEWLGAKTRFQSLNCHALSFAAQDTRKKACFIFPWRAIRNWRPL